MNNIEFKIAFGNLVRRYREKAGLQQTDVARLVYRDEERSSRVSDVERGRYNPQAATVADYREALQIPTKEIDALREYEANDLSQKDYTDALVHQVLLSEVARLHNDIVRNGVEWEELKEKGCTLGEQGNVTDGRSHLLEGATKLGNIVELYRSHRHVFSEKSRSEIDACLKQVEHEQNDNLLSLINAIQLIYCEVEGVLERLNLGNIEVEA